MAGQAFRLGFTLAEVLITLGIIGVVAALTMPALIQNHKKQVTSARLKKFYSTMMQAYTFAELEQGIAMEDWVFNDTSSGSNLERAENYYNTFLNNNYLNVLSVKRGLWPASYNREALVVTFADGSILYLWAGSAIDMLYDVNGNKGPNKDGSDCFKFMHYPKQRFAPYLISGAATASVTTRARALEVCKQYPAECTTLIMYDGWEFKDDYPYRL